MPQSRFDIGQTLQEALALHRQGRLRDAEKIYTRVLKAAPGNFDALHLLGLVKAEAGNWRGVSADGAALKINPGVADVWSISPTCLHALKREPEALDALDRALALRPGDPGSL